MFILWLALAAGAAGASARPSPAALSGDEFDWPLSGPKGLANLIENKQFHLNEAVLLSGIRPENDKPSKAAVAGKKRAGRDWVFEDSTAAAWVSGVDAPEAGRPVVLAARLVERDGALSVEASLRLNMGQPERTVLRPGELVFFELHGNKSVTCPVELAGDAVEIVHHNAFEYAVLKAVRRGTARLKIFSRWWNSAEMKLSAECELVVE
jgi:hypothetical protein